ncbi:MAG: class F sortase [Dehalococcoidia bacterium]|nr:class F sortase [Dehalococcoidia bacterium]
MSTLLWTVGGTALCAGAVLLAVGLYYTFNGNDGAHPPRSLALESGRDPGGIYDVPSLAPTPSPAPSAPAPPLRDAPFRLVIPKIAVDAAVLTYGLDANSVPEVPLNAQEVAWYDFSARPGTGGNAVFAGHVTWNGAAVFYRLDELAAGDQVVLRGEDGTELAYTVTDTFLVDPNDPSSLSVMGATESDVITIITCGGTFFYTGDPVFNGDYTNRRIVRAGLAGISTPPSAPQAAAAGAR